MIVVSVCLPLLSAYHLTGVSLTLDVGYLITDPTPDLERRVSPLSHLLLTALVPGSHNSSTAVPHNMLLEISGKITPERMKRRSQSKNSTQLWEVNGDGSKVWCCKEQWCIGTLNVRSVIQGKLEVVKQEIVRVNVDILEISWLKWTGMSEFNSNDHCIYYCGQESLRRSGIAIIVNKRVWNTVLGCNLKNDRMTSVRFQGKPFNIMVIQVYE